MSGLVSASSRLSAGLDRTFAATAFCSGPPTDRLDPLELVTVDGNRWSGPGDPTLYFAGDPGVALAEVGRHWEQGSAGQALWRVNLALAAVIDLRDAEVRAATGIPTDPRWFLDRGRCRELAARYRSAGCDGMIVPSVAFLDDLDRWNAVVFVDRAADLDRVVRDARPVVWFGQTASQLESRPQRNTTTAIPRLEDG